MRREYLINLSVNGWRLKKAVIDSHYENRHSKTVNDKLILFLLFSLDGQRFEADETAEGFEYYATEPHFYDGKPFKIIWLLPPSKDFIGIVTCYRRSI